MATLSKRQIELLQEALLHYHQAITISVDAGYPMNELLREIRRVQNLLSPFDIEQAVDSVTGIDTIVECAHHLLAHRECPVHSPEAKDLARAIEQLPHTKIEVRKEPEPKPDAMITLVLKDDELNCGGTVQDMLHSGGRLIDSCMEPPTAVFKVDDDPRWWVASVELVISEANPDYVQELLDEKASEDNGDDDSI